MFWEKYVALCRKCGKSPNTVAAEIGIKSSGTVTGWKNGALPREWVLQTLSEKFEVSVEWLKGEFAQKEKTPTRESEGTDRELEYIRLFKMLSPEDQDREIAYLREKTNVQ